MVSTKDEVDNDQHPAGTSSNSDKWDIIKDQCVISS